MIVVGSIIAVSLIGAYIFLGIKLSESIVNPDVKIFFWGLYITTLMTLVNVSISIYFYSSIINKKGPLGPRGSKGKMGDRGDSGSCSDDDCRSKTLQLMVEQEIKDKTEDEPTPMEKKMICAIIKQNITPIKNMTLEQLINFKTKLKNNINGDYWKQNRTERIKLQNSGNNLTEIYNLMTKSNSIFDVNTDIDVCIE